MAPWHQHLKHCGISLNIVCYFATMLINSIDAHFEENISNVQPVPSHLMAQHW